MILEIIVIFLVIAIVFAFYIIKRLNSDLSRFKYIANVLEAHKLNIDSIEKSLDVDQLREDLFSSFIDDINSKIESNSSEINSSMVQLKKSVEEYLYDNRVKVQNDIDVLKDSMDYRFINIENGLKGMTINPRDNYIREGNNEVNNLYSQGLSKEDIAKELKVSKSEVDFALKLSKLK